MLLTLYCHALVFSDLELPVEFMQFQRHQKLLFFDGYIQGRNQKEIWGF